MPQTIYYPAKSRWWDQMNQRTALGQPVSTNQIRAAAEGERFGELSAMYNAQESNRRYQLSKEELALKEKGMEGQEEAAKWGTITQAAVAAPMMYGTGKMMGWWGGKAPAVSTPEAIREYQALGYKPLSEAPSYATENFAPPINTPTYTPYGTPINAAYEEQLAYNPEQAAGVAAWAPGEYGAQGGIGTGIGEYSSMLGEGASNYLPYLGYYQLARQAGDIFGKNTFMNRSLNYPLSGIPSELLRLIGLDDAGNFLQKTEENLIQKPIDWAGEQIGNLAESAWEAVTSW